MTTLDDWLFVGEVFAILGLFWLMLMWVLDRIADWNERRER